MAILGSAFQVFDRSGSGELQVLDGKESLEVLKTADDLLDEALKLLSGIKDDLSTRQYKIYHCKYRQLYLMVVDVKSDVREREGKPTLFSGKEEQDEFHSQVQILLRYCQAYHTDIVGASRKVCAQSSLDLELEPAESSTGTLSSTMVPSISTGSLAETFHYLPNGTASLPLTFRNHTPGIRLTLRYTPPSGRTIFAGVTDTLTKSPGNSPYALAIACVSGTRSTVMVQPDYRPGDVDAERSLEDILWFKNTIMQSDLDSLEEWKVEDQSVGISWITSILSSFRLGPLDITSGMV